MAVEKPVLVRLTVSLYAAVVGPEVVPDIGVPEQGAKQEIAAVQPAFCTEPSEINRIVNSPLVAVEVKVPGEVVPLKPPAGCNAGEAIVGPSYISKESQHDSVSKAEKDNLTFDPAVAGEMVIVLFSLAA